MQNNEKLDERIAALKEVGNELLDKKKLQCAQTTISVAKKHSGLNFHDEQMKKKMRLLHPDLGEITEEKANDLQRLYDRIQRRTISDEEAAKKFLEIKRKYK